MSPQPKWRVSAERLATMAPLCELPRQRGHEPDNIAYRGVEAIGLVLDLRDARAEIDTLQAAVALSYKALGSLMDELTGKRATDWGIVNEAAVACNRVLARTDKLLPEDGPK